MQRNATAVLAVAAVGLMIAGLSATATGGAEPSPRLHAQNPAAAPAVAAQAAAAAPTPKPVRSSVAPAAVPKPAAMTPAAQTELVATYCGGCHSDRARAGGLSLADFSAMRAAESPEVVEKMLRKLRAGMMPPAGAKRPPAGSLDELMTALEARMDEHAAVNPNPGWRPFQRLNRAEYGRAVQDLLGVEVDVAPLLPPDTISHGFDNVADAQTFSPALMEGYLRAASKVTALAVGDPDSAAGESTYSLPKTASQLTRAEGAPLGTRGGISVAHTFPADGEYVFRLDFFAEPLGMLFGNTATGEQIEVSINGERVALFDIDPRMNETTSSLSLKTPPVHVAAGSQRVTAAFLQRFEGPVNDLMAPIEHTMADTEIGIAVGITTLPHLRNLAVVGPHKVTGMSDTASRRRIFTCRPTSQADEAACATSIVKSLAARAFRRDPTERELSRLMAFYDTGRKDRTFEVGVTKAVEAILASPQFLFRLESTPATAKPGQPYRLTEVELASRLSFFLWAAGPDPALLAAATQGKLATPASIEKHVARLLADPRSEALATRFASQWLRLQDLDDVSPDPILYPYYDRTLAQALQRESELFLDSLVREDRSVLDLLTADYTFVNDRVARHYGLPGVSGPQFRRVSLPPERRGILGHGSVLTLTSIADRTSPVQRGKWIMEVLLGSPPPAPPPNVPALEDTKGTADGKMLSVRERMEAHRKNPACMSCHKVIDPLGLALEHYDATGRYRIKDNGVAVDAVGDLYDGTRMEGEAGLRNALVAHKDAFLLSFTEHLMTYALGRRVEPTDMPAVRAVIRHAARHDYRISAFVQGVVASDSFQKSVVRSAAPISTEQGPAHRDQGPGEELNMASVISNSHLSRRTALKGLGATIALPFLDAMRPARALHAAAADRKLRLIAIEMVHGAAGSTTYGAKMNMWAPAATGSAFDLSGTAMAALEPYRQHVTIVSNTDCRNAEAFSAPEIGADHFRSAAVFLTQSKPKQTQGSDVLAGTSLDQIFARQFGQDTPIPSLQLCIENVDQAGGCSYNYSCVYTDSISWASPTEPLPMIRDPRAVFDQLFGVGTTPEARKARRRDDKSILDFVAESVGELKGRLGVADRARLADYLDDVREIERRIEKVEAGNSSGEARELPGAPIGVPDSWEEHVKLMFDLQAVAFASDITRVFAFKMSRDVSNRVFGPSGSSAAFHTASHHQEREDRIKDFQKINAYHVSLVPYLLERLANTPDGDGTMLDNSLVVYGSAMGNSNMHNHKRCPLFLAGHAGGRLKGNLHVKAADGTPMANAMLSALQAVGVEARSFGDSTGTIDLNRAVAATAAAL